MSALAGFQDGETITMGTASFTYGTDFTSVGGFISRAISVGLDVSYDAAGIVTFANNTGADIAFSSSNATALATLGLPATLSDTQTQSLTPAIPLSTEPIFDEMAFRANDLDTLYKDDGTALNLKTGNTITLDVNGAETTIVYGTDFTSINDLMNQINTISGLTSTVDETNNALKFTNNTASPIELKLKSSNVALIQTLGLPSTTTISSDASITSSSLKVPSYRALNEVYDASGTKLLLSSTYTLTSREPQTWQMQSGIYDKQGDQLLSPQTVSGTLRFDANGVLSAVTGVPATLTLPDGTSILYDSTQDKTAVDLAAAGQSVPTLHQTTGAIYMSSTMKQNNIDGNAQGYYQGMDIDQNGIISLSFSNDKFETFGRVGVAGFINNQGLSQSDSTLFKESANSGTPTLLWNWGQKTGELRGTSVLSGRLEMSNVDLATALTELMIFQRAYSASTKSITTADEMVKEAIGLKR